MENNYINFESPEDRGKYARELRSYFEKYNISLSEWWASPNPTKEEILIHHRNGKLENEREISRVSIQLDEQGKLSFGLSGYNYRIGEEVRNICVARGYSYKIHVQKPKKSNENNPEKREPILGRWWITNSFNNLEEIVRELKELEFILTERN